MIITRINEGKITNFHNADMVEAVEAIELNGKPGIRIHFPGLHSDIGGMTANEYLKLENERCESERRQELAKAALIGIMANPDSKLSAEEAAKKAVRYADALIEELKKGGEQ